MGYQLSKIVEQSLQEITDEWCDNFCKWQPTCDENGECEWIRQGNDCPLDKL